jgi:hypothetical protein
MIKYCPECKTNKTIQPRSDSRSIVGMCAGCASNIPIATVANNYFLRYQDKDREVVHTNPQ